MQLFPAIDLRGGQVVRLTQGDYDRMTVYGQDPCAQARSFVAAGAKNLHVVDLDGAKDGTLSNYDTIAALAKQGGLYIEVGGGIRTEERIEKYLSLGVGRCILGSVAVTDFAFTARMLQKYGDKIAVGVDAKDGYVAIHGWKEISAEPGVAFCKRLAQAGCTAIIYTDIACDGAMQGTNLCPVPSAGSRGARGGLYGQRRHLLRGRAAGIAADGHGSGHSGQKPVHRRAGPCPLRAAGAGLRKRGLYDNQTHHPLSGRARRPGGQGHEL